MPSASAKLEKQASTEAGDSIRQAITVIEHKIRNLEKRKGRLESYKEEQKKGKELNADQLLAVSKYEEVIQTLEFARDLSKQFNGIAIETAKFVKKQQRREQAERAQQELIRIKEILIVQDVLQNMGQDEVRNDFLVGQNGATQLTEDDLKHLDDLYIAVSPKHGAEDGAPPYQEQLTQAADHFVSLVEGRTKEVVGTTYQNLKELVHRIHSCGYFDENGDEVEAEQEVAGFEATEEVTATTLGSLQDDGPEEDYSDAQETLTAQQLGSEEELPVPEEVLSSGSELPVPPSNQIPTPAPVPAQLATAGSENSFFGSGTAPAPFAASQQRPLNEVMNSVSGNFNFLQDSQLEMESPHVDLAGMLVQSGPGQFPGQQPDSHQPVQTNTSPALSPATQPQQQPAPVVEFNQAIHTQTFTNQNFPVLPNSMPAAQPYVEPGRTGVQPPPAAVPSQIASQQQSHIPGFAQPGFQGAIPPAMAATDNMPSVALTQRAQEDGTYVSQLSSGSYEGSGFNAAQSVAATFPGNQPQQQAHAGYGAQPQQTQQQAAGFPPQQSAVNVASQQNIPVSSGSQGATTAYESSQSTASDKAGFDSSDHIEDWSEDVTSQSTNSWGQTGNQGDGYVYQNNNSRGYRGRGGMNRGRGSSNGYSRGRGNYQNGGRGGGYNYRGGNQEGNNYFQNGYRGENYGNGNNNFNGGYKRGAPGGGAPRGGNVNRGGPRGGGGGGSGNRGGNPRGGRGGNFVRPKQ